jgi:Protein of unknown function (DUF4087)
MAAGIEVREARRMGLVESRSANCNAFSMMEKDDDVLDHCSGPFHLGERNSTMRPFSDSVMLVVTVFSAGCAIASSEAAEKRCGWLQNPTPPNWWLEAVAPAILADRAAVRQRVLYGVGHAYLFIEQLKVACPRRSAGCRRGGMIGRRA